MKKAKKNRRLRLITKFEDKAEYWKHIPETKEGKPRELRDMCPSCSDQESYTRIYPYWLLRDRGPNHNPRWEKVNKKCPVCNRIFSLENREVETF